MGIFWHSDVVESFFDDCVGALSHHFVDQHHFAETRRSEAPAQEGKSDAGFHREFTNNEDGRHFFIERKILNYFHVFSLQTQTANHRLCCDFYFCFVFSFFSEIVQ